jgi:hypothetical protein
MKNIAVRQQKLRSRPSWQGDFDRESWLRIAQGWMGLIRNRLPSDEEAFEAQSTAKRTQDESNTQQ